MIFVCSCTESTFEHPTSRIAVATQRHVYCNWIFDHHLLDLVGRIHLVPIYSEMISSNLEISLLNFGEFGYAKLFLKMYRKINTLYCVRCVNSALISIFFKCNWYKFYCNIPDQKKLCSNLLLCLLLRGSLWANRFDKLISHYAIQ